MPTRKFSHTSTHAKENYHYYKSLLTTPAAVGHVETRALLGPGLVNKQRTVCPCRSVSFQRETSVCFTMFVTNPVILIWLNGIFKEADSETTQTCWCLSTSWSLSASLSAADITELAGSFVWFTEVIITDTLYPGYSWQHLFFWCCKEEINTKCDKTRTTVQ